MKIFNTKKELQNHLAGLRKAGLKIALVPTMGALHEGHISLINQAEKVADVIVCSIFVNPTQFNDPADLEKYPRPLAQDLALLGETKCDIVFTPTVAEMYPADDSEWHIELGALDNVWEGAMRPGHFQGVTQIVYKLFKLVEPDIACFGQKDFQQVMVIQRLVDIKELPIKIEICPIIRDTDGLALSSRNVRLSASGKHKALALSRALHLIKSNLGSASLASLKKQALEVLTAEGDIDVEYLAICESHNLSEVATMDDADNIVALLVAWVDGVRLIDNMILK